MNTMTPADWLGLAHFEPREVACRCGCGAGPFDVDADLMRAVEELRELAGIPLSVTSGYRCTTHNTRVGGVPLSFHTQGLAIDLAPLPGRVIGPLFALAVCMQRFRGHGYDLNRGFCHFDMGTTAPRWWVYLPNKATFPADRRLVARYHATPVEEWQRRIREGLA